MARHRNILDESNAVLVMVDLQEAFAAPIFQFDNIVARAAIVIEASKLLGVPMLITEQAPAKLGATVQAIKRVLPASAELMGKSAFSACGAPGFVDALAKFKRRQIMLCGIEAHVCMNQSAHD